ncbi:MAG: hypothetical protein ACOH2V_08160 [Candidatus Saccharimonadaceae bacterium]
MISEELKDEIRKIIKEEISSISFLKKELNEPLSRYIRGMIHGEIKSYKMFQAGFRPDDGTTYIISNERPASLSFQVENQTDLYDVYCRLLEEKKIDCTFEIFESVLSFKEKDGNRINWIHKIVRTKGVEQRSIFDLLYSLDKRIISYEKFRRKRFITFICRSFVIDGRELIEKNINDTFGIWRNKKKIEQI